MVNTSPRKTIALYITFTELTIPPKLTAWQHSPPTPALTMRSLIQLLPLLLCPTTLIAEISLPPHFADHAVFQREKVVTVWGQADAGAKVVAELAGHTVEVSANNEGRFILELPALPAGGPHELVIRSGEDERRLQDLLIGEVWLASGQSNMEWRLGASDSLEAVREEIAGNTQIRGFEQINTHAETPAAETVGEWSIATPQNVHKFSGVAIHFALALHKKLGVPVGILDADWGGTPVCAWMPRESLEAVDAFAEELKADKESPHQQLDQERERKLAWRANPAVQDPGNRGYMLGFAERELNDDSWGSIKLPSTIEKHGIKIDGAIWFRKQITIPEDWTGPSLLSLGAVDDFETTYVNGVEVGATGKEVPNSYAHPREYPVSEELTKPGKDMVIAVRVFDHFGGGGFTGASKQLFLQSATSERIALAGEWKYRVEVAIPDPLNDKSYRYANLSGDGNRNRPARLFNGMIHPLIPYGIRGAIWYQAEADAGKPELYKQLFPAMIQGWRMNWGEAFPFYFVQLTRYGNPVEQPVQEGHSWAYIREAQMAALALPDTGMICLIDEGNPTDIHPKNKRVVGERLAALALEETYEKDIRGHHPVYYSVKNTGKQAQLTFAYTYGSLKTSDGNLPRGFAVRSEDGDWIAANAQIESETIVLSHPDPSATISAVRYGWANFPDTNVVNAAGLPLAPFRTDKQSK